MKYKDGTKVLLALFIAYDEMIHIVNMFLEVVFMNVAENTNNEAYELHLLIVKDADGTTQIGCSTVIPSKQRWVFKKI